MNTGGRARSSRCYAKWRQACRWLAAPRDGGFTIIEVLVVLAVTALLFISAAVLISGRQDRTAFEQAIRDIQSQIQKVINEVSIGYYPNFGTVNCTATVSGPSFTTTSGAGQGVNSGCVALGKAIQFKVSGVSAGDPEQFRVYTLAGLRQVGEQEADSYAAAQPKVVAPPSPADVGTVPDISEPGTLQSGLGVQDMYWLNNAGTVRTNVSTIAFVSSLAQYNGNSLNSGSQQINIIPIFGTPLNSSTYATVTAINTNLVNPAISPVNPGKGVTICFVSGGSNQSGVMTIGGLNRDLSVQLSVRSTTTCP